MTVSFARHADQTTARWLCGCGRAYPIDGPAYPICECGQRCRMVDADGLPFVTSLEARLERARAAHEEAYEAWLIRRVWLRAELAQEPSPCRPDGASKLAAWLVDNAPRVNERAAYVDLVEREIAAVGGGEHA